MKSTRSPDTKNLFTEILYGDKPAHSWILTWEAKTKKSAWFDTVKKLDAHLAKHTKDIYVGIGLSPDPSKITYPNPEDNKKPIIYRRCPANQILGTAALYVEIDIKSDTHKETNLPPDLNSALSLVKDWGYDPSMVVHSGNGIHCYWVFKEPWIFDSPDERQEAANLSKRLSETIKSKATDNKWKMDSVFDLSRILRPPDTQNCKSEPPKAVRLLEMTDHRYNPSDFDDLLIPMTSVSPVVLGSTVSDGKDDPISKILNNVKFDWDNAIPPQDKFETLSNVFAPKFKQTYLNKRKGDLSDTSASGYDMSLCIFAAQAKWEDQEMVDLMIAHRRSNGHIKTTDKKNLKKFATTIVNAREKVAANEEKQSERREYLKKIRDLPETEKNKHLRENTSKLIFDEVEILKFTKYDGENPSYTVETNLGNAKFPDMNSINTSKIFRTKIMETTNRFVNDKKLKLQWTPFLEEMFECLIICTVGEEQTLIGRYKTWIQEFLAPAPKHDLAYEYNHSKRAFYDQTDGRWWIWMDHLSTYVLTTTGRQISGKEISVELTQIQQMNKNLDILRATHHVKTDEGRRTTVSLWKIPKEWHPDV